MKTTPQKLSALIVGANASELVPFVRLGKRHFLIQANIGYLAAGIGPVAAAFGLTHFLQDYRPQRIVAIGTAGAINTEKLAIGDVVLAKSVSTDGGLDGVYTPRLQRAAIKLKIPPQKNMIKLGSVFCPQEISCTEARRVALARAGHDAEHLESFAYAFVAQKFRIPCTIYLGVSNTVGKQAHSEWKKYGVEALQRAVKICLPIIESIR